MNTIEKLLAENVLRGSSPHAENARKTHCPRGHEYNELNSRKYKIKGTDGYGRRCRICDAINHRIASERKQTKQLKD